MVATGRGLRRMSCHVPARPSRIPTLPYLTGLPRIPACPAEQRIREEPEVVFTGSGSTSPTGILQLLRPQTQGYHLELHGKWPSGLSSLESKQKSHQRSYRKQEETTMDDPHSISRTLLGKPSGESCLVRGLARYKTQAASALPPNPQTKTESASQQKQ